MAELSSDDIEDVREVFDLFDFWDGRDGMVDGFKIGDFLRCCGLDPTESLVMANGGTKKLGEKAYKFEEILPIFKVVSSEGAPGTMAEFKEAFKTYDREGQGYINAAELRHVLKSLAADDQRRTYYLYTDVNNALVCRSSTAAVCGK